MVSQNVVRAARENGKLGGRPTSQLTELRRKARERATRLLCGQQEESIKFLIYVRDNPNLATADRVRCAIEILNRGEVPSKTANYFGAAGAGGELLDEPPKLFVLGKYGAKEKANGDASDTAKTNGSEASGEPA